MTQAMQQQILDFWFGPPGSADYGTTRDAWFRKNASFDAEIGLRFGAVIETALGGGLADWTARRARARTRPRPVHAQPLSRLGARVRRRCAGDRRGDRSRRSRAGPRADPGRALVLVHAVRAR
jgi:hypothetical protein